ncbi:unnamed protein product [Cuscuta campestris]|uniref:Uncharacterized protein n=1 Tax=Cuscuta campestris TaxID=132261 RepID=A0A484M1A6_9ASTE|nr:unnamed protein product [Cuscuta campestris]
MISDGLCKLTRGGQGRGDPRRSAETRPTAVSDEATRDGAIRGCPPGKATRAQMPMLEGSSVSRFTIRVRFATDRDGGPGSAQLVAEHGSRQRRGGAKVPICSRHPICVSM